MRLHASRFAEIFGKVWVGTTQLDTCETKQGSDIQEIGIGNRQHPELSRRSGSCDHRPHPSSSLQMPVLLALYLSVTEQTLPMLFLLRVKTKSQTQTSGSSQYLCGGKIRTYLILQNPQRDKKSNKALPRYREVKCIRRLSTAKAVASRTLRLLSNSRL